MSKKIGWIAAILSVIAIILGIAALAAAKKPAEKVEPEEKDVQYVLYLGTNDKDTNEPVCTHEEAMQIVEDILVEHLGGFTLQEANGGWKDGETLYREYSIVARISDAKEEDVRASADDLIRALNQSSILIESNRSRTEFYSGQ